MTCSAFDWMGGRQHGWGGGGGGWLKKQLLKIPEIDLVLTSEKDYEAMSSKFHCQF